MTSGVPSFAPVSLSVAPPVLMTRVRIDAVEFNLDMGIAPSTEQAAVALPASAPANAVHGGVGLIGSCTPAKLAAEFRKQDETDQAPFSLAGPEFLPDLRFDVSMPEAGQAMASSINSASTPVPQLPAPVSFAPTELPPMRSVREEPLPTGSVDGEVRVKEEPGDSLPTEAAEPRPIPAMPFATAASGPERAPQPAVTVTEPVAAPIPAPAFMNAKQIAAPVREAAAAPLPGLPWSAKNGESPRTAPAAADFSGRSKVPAADDSASSKPATDPTGNQSLEPLQRRMIDAGAVTAGEGAETNPQPPAVHGRSDAMLAPTGPAPAQIFAPAPEPAAIRTLGSGLIDLRYEDGWIGRMAADIAAAHANEDMVRFQLLPRHLGRIEVMLREGEAGLAVQIATEHEQAAALVGPVQTRLVEELRQHGVRVASSEVGSGSFEQSPSPQHHERARQSPLPREWEGGIPHQMTTAAAITKRPYRFA